MRRFLIPVMFVLAVGLAASDWSFVAKNAEPSIPRLEIHAGEALGICSGIVINDQIAMLVTAAHCFPEDGKFDVTVNGRDAKFVKANHALDMALVTFRAKHEKAITLAPEAPEQGSEIAVVGYPFGSETFHIQAGLVAAPYDRDCRCLKLNADVIFGDSGGAIVDYQGRLVGLTTTIFAQGPAHLSGAIPVEAVRDFAEAYLPKTRSGTTPIQTIK